MTITLNETQRSGLRDLRFILQGLELGKPGALPQDGLAAIDMVLSDQVTVAVKENGTDGKDNS